MNKTFSFCLFLLLSFWNPLQSQRTNETIYSKKLDAEREIWIELPKNFSNDTKKTYPLVLVLDGAYLLNVVSGAYQYGSYWDEFPEAVLVGISQEKSEDRYLDSEADLSEKGLTDRSGAFFEFIGTELIPMLEKKYRVGNYKVIVGHDITAGFLHFFLFKDQPLFQGYITLSPEFPDTLEEKFIERLPYLNQKIAYYLVSSEFDDATILKDCQTIDAAFKSNPNQQVSFHFEELKGKDHYSLVPFAVPNALYHIFGMYQPISPKEYQEKISVLTENQTQYLVDKYNEIEKIFQTNTKPRFSDFKAIEAAILKHQNYQELGVLANVAKKYYPKTLLENYFNGMMFEKQNYLDKASREYKNGITKLPVGDINADFLIEKVATLGKN